VRASRKRKLSQRLKMTYLVRCGRSFQWLKGLLTKMTHRRRDTLTLIRPKQPAVAEARLVGLRRYTSVIDGCSGAGRVVLIIAGALNWGWLVAAGIAPVLVAVAPCAIMCALGLCGMKIMSGSNAAQEIAAAAIPVDGRVVGLDPSDGHSTTTLELLPGGR